MTSSFPIVITEIAARQIREAADWWHSHRVGVAGLLGDELEAAFRLLTFQPLAGTPVPDATKPGVRRVLLRKTQYHLYYCVDPDGDSVVVLAFWSSRRGSPPEV